MCKAHRTSIEDLVQRLIEAADNAMEAPNDTNLVQLEIEDDDYTPLQEAFNEPLPPSISPPATQLAHPNRQPARGSRGQKERVPRTNSTNPNRGKEHSAIPSVPRQRGALAMPVAPLPAGLVLGSSGRPVTLDSDHRLQRQSIVQSLNRLSREESAMELQRRIKITMWTSVVFTFTLSRLMC